MRTLRYKNFIFSSLAVLLFLVPALHGAGCLWTNSDSNADWNSSDNWDADVPDPNDNALIKGSTGGIWPKISTGTTVRPNGIWIGYSNSLGIPDLTVEFNASLDTTGVSVGFVADGILNIEGGPVNVTSGGINIGCGNEWGYGHGTVNITGGKTTTVHLRFGTYLSGQHQGGTGRLNLHCGTLRVFNLENLETPGCSINIEKGTLVLTGSCTLTDVQNWVAGGFLTAYDGLGEILADDVGDIVITAKAPGSKLNTLFDDAKIDTADLAAVSGQWLNTGCDESGQWCSGADVDGDGTVNAKDFVKVAEFWKSGPWYGLHVNANGTLLRNGSPFTGYGVNYFDCFFDEIKYPGNNRYIYGFSGLNSHNIKYARMMGCGFWPSEMQLYFTDKEEYFRRFDAVIASAEQYNVGLIPTLFWTHYTIADIVGEPVSNIGNPKSQTMIAMKQYIKDVVTRYLNSPAIWGWEIGNEWNNAVDLPNALDHRPPTHTGLGNPSFRTWQDDMTHEVLVCAMTALATEIRKYDPYRMISSGNSYTRPSAYHQWKELSWTQDIDNQHKLMAKLQNPDPIDCISFHYYETDRDLVMGKAAADETNKTFFVGEFGARGYTQETADMFDLIVSYIEASNAPIAAVWVYNRNLSSDDWNIFPEFHDLRYYQLQEIMSLNQ